ncbi:MAG: DUF262 domain-containing protein [Thermoanaerobaculia bacterium]
MKDAQKPDHVSLNTLIGRLKEGRYVIPDFQREFEWRPWDIRELVRSIFSDYYIGSLLLWKGKKETFAALSCEPIYAQKTKGNAEFVVLDGQQRLTAMHYVFMAPDAPLPHRRSRFVYYIAVDKFMTEAYDEAFDYDVLSKRWGALLLDREDQFERHIFPLSVLGGGRFDFPNWVQGYEKHWTDKATSCADAGDVAGERVARSHSENAASFGQQIGDIAEQYQISYIELDADLAVDKVCDIFTQINSRGIRLDVFDLINALLKPKGLQLKQLYRDSATGMDLSGQEKLQDKMNVYILQVMSILRQTYCSPKYLYFLLPGEEKQVRDPDGTRRKEVLIADVNDFKARWLAAVETLKDAIKAIRDPREYGAISGAYWPYVSILPGFAALRAHAKTLPPPRQLDAQRKIRHWYWSSVFTSRYSGSVESTTARDFLDVRAWMDDDAAEPSVVREFAERARRLDLQSETKKGNSVYNGIFNLYVLQGARDWVTGGAPRHDDLDDHHIVPDSWGKKNIKGDLIHSILNRTPLTQETNRHVISDRLPNEYLPELIKQSGESVVREVLESHLISPAALAILLRDPFGPEDYEAFILERQRTIQDAIENLLIKERLGLPPKLRELDAAVERVELSLRKEVLKIVEGSEAAVPSHILQKVDERVCRATKKNVALDADRYDTIEGKLEFFDLREIQDTMVSKNLWPKFEVRFSNKEMLVKKFDQLSELRNGIRHSRSVDEVVRKEGEAAIIWFDQVLAK